MADVEVVGTTSSTITIVVDAVVQASIPTGTICVTRAILQVFDAGNSGLTVQNCYAGANLPVEGTADPESEGTRIKFEFVLHHSMPVTCPVDPIKDLVDDGSLAITVVDPNGFPLDLQLNRVHIP